MRPFALFLHLTDLPTTRANLQGHVEHLDALARLGRVLAAGPFEDEAKGGLVIGLFADATDARTFGEADPFVRSGERRLEVRPWSWSRPENGQLGLLSPKPGGLPGFDETLRLRWSCRDFDASQRLSHDEALDLVDLALQAPSEFNLQPNRPVICHHEADRARLRAACWNQAHVQSAAMAVVCTVDPTLFRSEVPRTVSDFIARGRYDESARPEREAAIHRFYADDATLLTSAIRCGSLFGHQLLLAGLARGLAGCWLVGFEREALYAALGLPEHIVVAGIVALGRPASVGAPMPRPPASMVVRWGRWA